MKQSREPEIDPLKYVQLIFDKDAKEIQRRNETIFNKWCCSKWTPTGKKMNLDLNLTPYTKINSKHIMDWKVKHKTIKLFENWASLVAQWLRICLLMQGTRVRALVWEDPTCRGAARPVSHSY